VGREPGSIPTNTMEGHWWRYEWDSLFVWCLTALSAQQGYIVP